MRYAAGLLAMLAVREAVVTKPMRETLISVAGIIFTALAAVGLAMAAGSVAAEVRISWDPNPPAQNIVSYTVDVDGNQLSVSDTDALCSEFTPPLDCEDGKLHVARVKAINADGFESVWSADRPFGPGSGPVNVSAQRE